MDLGLLFERPKVGDGDLFDMHDDGCMESILNQRQQQKRAMIMMEGGFEKYNEQDGADGALRHKFSTASRVDSRGSIVRAQKSTSKSRSGRLLTQYSVL